VGIFDKTTKMVEIEVHSDFAGRLTRARKASGKTQAELAKALGRSRTAVTNWELGKALPELPVFVEWCKVCGTTPNDILGF